MVIKSHMEGCSDTGSRGCTKTSSEGRVYSARIEVEWVKWSSVEYSTDIRDGASPASLMHMLGDDHTWNPNHVKAAASLLQDTMALAASSVKQQHHSSSLPSSSHTSRRVAHGHRSS